MYRFVIDKLKMGRKKKIQRYSDSHDRNISKANENFESIIHLYSIGQVERDEAFKAMELCIKYFRKKWDI